MASRRRALQRRPQGRPPRRVDMYNEFKIYTLRVSFVSSHGLSATSCTRRGRTLSRSCLPSPSCAVCPAQAASAARTASSSIRSNTPHAKSNSTCCPSKSSSSSTISAVSAVPGAPASAGGRAFASRRNASIRFTSPLSVDTGPIPGFCGGETSSRFPACSSGNVRCV